MEEGARVRGDRMEKWPEPASGLAILRPVCRVSARYDTRQCFFFKSHQFAECRPMAHSVNYLKKPKRLVAECRDDWALGKHFKKKCPPIFPILKNPCSPLTRNFKKSLLHFCRVPPMQHSANLFLYFMLPFSFLYLITFLYFMFH